MQGFGSRLTRALSFFAEDYDRRPVPGRPAVAEGAAEERLARISAGMDDLLRRLEQAYASQQQLVRGIGHDLRSPLASIVSMAEALAAGEVGELSEEQARYCAMVAATAERLIGQVELLYALADARDSSALDPVEFDVRSVTAGVVEGYRPSADAKGLSLELAADAEELRLLGDPTAIERIVANLVDNAIKFTDAGSVDVSLSVEDGDVRIEVADTGIGIGEDYLHLVMEEYFRAPSAAGRPGAGIGLTVTRDLVAGAGGRILVKSVQGDGSRFVVRIPARPLSAEDPTA